MDPHKRKLLRQPDITSDFRNPPSPPPVSSSASSSSYDYSPSKFLNLTGESKEDSSATATVVVILAVLLLFALFFTHIRRLGNQTRSLQRHNRPREQSPPRPPSQSVDLHIIKSLPVFSFRENEKYQSDCAICLGQYEEDECVKLIPFCQHVYHPSCIDTWLSSHVSCPMCRSTRLFKYEERDDPGGKLRRVPEKVSQGVSHSE